DRRRAAALRREHAIGLAQRAQRLQGQVLRVARPDADADQPHAPTSLWATSGVAAQCVCRNDAWTRPSTWPPVRVHASPPGVSVEEWNSCPRTVVPAGQTG